mmetsp:Transcript_25613/g.67124  ORF Transcript_25613/g.67124 Transcript_25613/m.67124 type:complete len:243 (-) Transcript_25613:142-870(-)
MTAGGRASRAALTAAAHSFLVEAASPNRGRSSTRALSASAAATTKAPGTCGSASTVHRYSGTRAKRSYSGCASGCRSHGAVRIVSSHPAAAADSGCIMSLPSPNRFESEPSSPLWLLWTLSRAAATPSDRLWRRRTSSVVWCRTTRTSPHTPPVPRWRRLPDLSSPPHPAPAHGHPINTVLEARAPPGRDRAANGAGYRMLCACACVPRIGRPRHSRASSQPAAIPKAHTVYTTEYTVTWVT